jgi:hypothetical protein
MNYCKRIIVVILTVAVILACSDKKKKEKVQIKSPENYQDLKDKYANLNFSNCEDYFEAGYEMINVYTSAIAKAYEGDSIARDELDKIEIFIESFDSQADKWRESCPEEFLEFDKAVDEQVIKYREQLMEIYSVREFDVEWDETLEQLEEQIRINLEEVEAHKVDRDDDEQ